MKIFRAASSELDKKYVQQLAPAQASVQKAHNLAEFVVTKPWGSEYLISSHETVEVWHLAINYLHSTSMHCHPRKKTALVVLEGRALFSSLNNSMELGPLDGVVIDAGTFHCTQSVSTQGLRVLEFETPPIKHDLIRLEDKYGRANSGYEGANFMVPIGTNFRLANQIGGRSLQFRNNLFYLANKNSPGWRKFKQDASGAMLGIVLRGPIKLGNQVFHTCDILSSDELNLLKPDGKSSIFCLAAKNDQDLSVFA